jgi:hypothetical protein
MQARHGLWPSIFGTRIQAPVAAVFTALLTGAVWPPAAAQSAAASTAPVISPQAQAALDQLLKIPAGATAQATAGVTGAMPVPMSPLAPQVPAGSRMQVVVRPGETLDRVIQRTLRDSPFRAELLRDAFVRLNRSGFPRGTPHWVLAGSVLQVPTPADLMSQVDPRWWPAPAQDAAAATASTSSERRNWVRYP